ncbi:disulfide bond formation protein B [Lutibaculum baratangense]|uniref:Periplasmic thiol:disulfide oxidoreductase DsbB, required for DsbA reoxidation n=1 Tax=Lutibaculum baratangense AMV1 TaxID=631454 RepID=V4QWM6_9HYPH|nr:disulfide bond formation protein B [Lutibaculum baratangense]ESR24157.1 Periplasmic thiol:disulfide oxidoreductase DsbB, required for DsbA reoxidation [Lutibaculum baratangense AMV1]
MTLSRWAFLLAAVAAATILGAWGFELIGGLPPCPLCLEQRVPYYVGVPLAVLAGLLAARAPLPARLLLGLFGLAMFVTAGIAAYHAGIEWGWWTGPTDCSGAVADVKDASSLLGQLGKAQVIRCDAAAWRLFGLSLAGYNALISAGLGLAALGAASKARA